MKTKTKLKTAITILCCLSNLFVSPNIGYAGDANYLNERVLQFARLNVGRQVNNGNCWVFPRDALIFAGGRFPGPRGSFPTTVFGRTISFSQIRAGDIVHFEYATFARYGRIYSRTGINHYAIIESSNYGVVYIFHQNWGGRRYVIRDFFNPRELVSGKITYYRPQTR